jgi:hypothetical protein
MGGRHQSELLERPESVLQTAKEVMMAVTQLLPCDPWGPVESLLRDYNDADLTEFVLSNAGLLLPTPTGRANFSHKTRNRFYLEVARNAYREREEVDRLRLLNNVVSHLVKKKPESANELDKALRRIGWTLAGDAIIPLEVLDPGDLDFVPKCARDDLLKAAKHISTDPAGAVSAACGAIDSVTEDIYQRHKLGDHRRASFEERVSQSLLAVRTLERLSGRLQEIGWESKKADELCERLGKAIAHTAFVMATLRSKMSDVHGSKPTLDVLVFNSVKWSTVICSMLTDDRLREDPTSAERR